MLLIEVDVFEASMQIEVVCDGKVIIWSTDDSVCQVYPNVCSLPAGGKLIPKERAKEWKREKIEENKRNEGQKEREKMEKEKGKKRGLRDVFHSKFFKHL